MKVHVATASASRTVSPTLADLCRLAILTPSVTTFEAFLRKHTEQQVKPFHVVSDEWLTDTGHVHKRSLFGCMHKIPETDTIITCIVSPATGRGASAAHPYIVHFSEEHFNGESILQYVSRLTE